MRTLAWLAVFLAYAAALAAVAGDNTAMSLSFIFNYDTIRPWLFYRGLFQDAPWSLGSWNVINSTFALDLVASWLAFAVGALLGPASRAQFLFGMLALPLAWTCLSALGWIMVCRLAWGRSPAREAAMVLAHAMPFAWFTAGQEYPFVLLFSRVHHVSTWAVLPWLVWLWLRAMARRDGNWWLAGASLALFGVAFSDMAIGAWFTAPALVAWPLGRVLSARRPRSLATCWRRGLAHGARHGIPLVGAMVLAKLASDPLLFESHQLRVSLATAARAAGNMAGYLAFAATSAPFVLPVWLALVVVVVGWPLARARRWWRGGDFVAHPAGNRRRARCVLAWWLPGAIIVPVLAGAVTGLAEPNFDTGKWSMELRTILPAVWLPLFVGWALLPWRFPRAWVAGASGVVAAGCLACIAVARPALHHLDPFATAFHACFAEQAVARDLQGGVGGLDFVLVLADPELPLRRFVPINPNGRTGAFYVLTNSNTDWFRGQVDFVVVNDSPTAKFPFPPLDRQSNTCVAGAWSGCRPENLVVVHEDFSLGQAGPAAAVVDCAGVRFAFPARPLTYDLRT